MRHNLFLALALLAGGGGEISTGQTGATLEAPGPTHLLTDAAEYGNHVPVVVTFTNMPGTPGDTIALALRGSPDIRNLVTLPTHGLTSGQLTFGGLGNASQYEARAFSQIASGVIARSHPFRVIKRVATDAAAYFLDDPVAVDFSAMPGGSGERIAIA